jgi:UDP-glucose 4-epimerase
MKRNTNFSPFNFPVYNRSAPEPSNPLPTLEDQFSPTNIAFPSLDANTLLSIDELRPKTPTLPETTTKFILVVGGLGYIGSHTSLELLRSGQNIIIIDNLVNSERGVLVKLKSLLDDHYQTSESRPSLEFFEADYRNQSLMSDILTKYKSDNGSSTISGVIHFAAYKAVGESFKKPLSYYDNNVGGMVNFCSTLAEFGIKTFIFSSSATVYGELASKGGRLLEEQCDNSSCSGLTNPYGRTKWMCEAILNDLAFSDPEWTIVALRYFNPIGCDASGKLGENPRNIPNNLMPIIVNAMSGKLEALNIFGTDWDTPDGTAIRDYIHVSDLALGHLAALRVTTTPELGTGYHIYNLGTGSGHSVKEIVDAMELASGVTIPINESGRREGDVGICIAEPSKSLQSLNWKTEKTLSEACFDICRYNGFIARRDTMISFQRRGTAVDILSRDSVIPFTRKQSVAFSRRESVFSYPRENSVVDVTRRESVIFVSSNLVT